MRSWTWWYATVFICAALISPVEQARAAPSYCSGGAHLKPEKVPANLVAAVARTMEIDDRAVREGTYVRCVGPQLMACYVGANLNCFQADTRRASRGGNKFCQSSPGSEIVPMAATGHDTIYEWSCRGKTAVAGKARVTIDPQGYVGEYWKKVH
jgi:hypothetical protein